MPRPAASARRTRSARSDRRTASTSSRPLISSGACTAQRSASSSRRSTSTPRLGAARAAAPARACGRARALATASRSRSGVDVEPARELHHVLVAHEVVRMLGDHRRRALAPRARGLRATTGRRRASSRSMRNSRNGVAPFTALDERFGIVAPHVGRVAAGREVGDLELHLEALLPLVAALGRGLAGGVGVVRERDLAGEVLQREEVLVGERGAARRDRVRHAGERERHHVGVALADHDLAAARRSRPSPSAGRRAAATSGRSASRREFLYFGPWPSSVRPPKPTGSPRASQIGNITRPRNESCSLLRAVHEREPGVDDVLARELLLLEVTAQRVVAVGRPAERELARRRRRRSRGCGGSGARCPPSARSSSRSW